MKGRREEEKKIGTKQETNGVREELRGKRERRRVKERTGGRDSG